MVGHPANAWCQNLRRLVWGIDLRAIYLFDTWETPPTPDCGKCHLVDADGSTRNQRDGCRPWAPAIALQQMRENPSATPREKEVLSCIASGLGCKATARNLNISEYTVRKHRASLLRKLGCSTATELLVYVLNQNSISGN